MDWRVFNQPEPDDEKLVDLNVWYGHPFPKKDENGIEIVPAYNEEGSATSSDRYSHLEDTPRSESSGILVSLIWLAVVVDLKHCRGVYTLKKCEWSSWVTPNFKTIRVPCLNILG